MTITDPDRIRSFLNDLDRDIIELAGRSFDDVESFQTACGDDSVSLATPNPNTPEDSQLWCERSLEQLEMTIQLLDQCLDNDLKDLNRQRGVISLCMEQIQSMKNAISQ
jgi:hypothetical protein